MLGTAEALKTYAFVVGDDGEIMSNVEASEDAGNELDRQAKKYAAAFKVSYQDALHEVLSQPENAELKSAYAGIQDQPATHQTGEAGMEVDRLAQAYVAKHGCDYTHAMRQVLADPANAKLKEVYGS